MKSSSTRVNGNEVSFVRTPYRQRAPATSTVTHPRPKRRLCIRHPHARPLINGIRGKDIRTLAISMVLGLQVRRARADRFFVKRRYETSIFHRTRLLTPETTTTGVATVATDCTMLSNCHVQERGTYGEGKFETTADRIPWPDYAADGSVG